MQAMHGADIDLSEGAATYAPFLQAPLHTVIESKHPTQHGFFLQERTGIVKKLDMAIKCQVFTNGLTHPVNAINDFG
jgi:hypothetical protein